MTVLSLAEALAALPDTADAIAAHLAAAGVKGVPENGECCPVANYLTGLDFDRVSVTLSRIQSRDYPDSRLADIRTPPPVQAFVRRFDAGEWPELVLADTAEVADV